MEVLRHIPGYLLAAVLVIVGLGMAYAAWLGWVSGLGMAWAVVALTMSLFGRLNVFTVVGAFFYADTHLNWSFTYSLAFAAVGLLYITPRVVGHMLEMFTRRHI